MNLRIVDGTVDRSHLLFPEVVCRVLERHAPERIAWWTAQPQGRFELRSDAPAVVFEELLDAFRGLAV
jgi:hypothetical protein